MPKNPNTKTVTLSQSYEEADWSNTTAARAVENIEQAYFDAERIINNYVISNGQLIIGKFITNKVLPECSKEDMVILGQIYQAIATVLGREETTEDQEELVIDILKTINEFKIRFKNAYEYAVVVDTGLSEEEIEIRRTIFKKGEECEEFLKFMNIKYKLKKSTQNKPLADKEDLAQLAEYHNYFFPLITSAPIYELKVLGSVALEEILNLLAEFKNSGIQTLDEPDSLSKANYEFHDTIKKHPEIKKLKSELKKDLELLISYINPRGEALVRSSSQIRLIDSMVKRGWFLRGFNRARLRPVSNQDGDIHKNPRAIVTRYARMMINFLEEDKSITQYMYTDQEFLAKEEISHADLVQMSPDLTLLMDTFFKEYNEIYEQLDYDNAPDDFKLKIRGEYLNHMIWSDPRLGAFIESIWRFYT